MFIVDFDDTLFDTQALKQARLEAVQQLGVSEEEYWESYREARNSHDGLFTYSDERHAEVLGARGYSRDEVLFQLKTTTGDMLPDFLFPDTIPFLQDLKKYQQPMILLSLGNPGFQKLKTEGAGVNPYFDQIYMVHDTKRHVLEQLFARNDVDNTVWFINDKVAETKDLAQEFPGLKPILKKSDRSSDEEYRQSGFPFFETLKQVGEYLQLHIPPYESR
ncbi:MAG: hypothetical protein A3J66_01345 [Candidatus Magasanikbacteria bacterium RIFCSPHIGHO2_02_FULL_47_14]|uniref:Haloacid dehalogenase n=1 Tax=Candidatus Magasanikbacteria bacterium RIFCSPHIGHO2_02_FULL_47_14 TaxID=1798680 RepID=A0A1F6M285_9BACT|nr:MAG: hypothetical protein A3J66_01345 [Candidatus Magasanikbacteria bacterium RIFCSPHIGHO2_02_FULL_47_14]